MNVDPKSDNTIELAFTNIPREPEQIAAILKQLVFQDGDVSSDPTPFYVGSGIMDTLGVLSKLGIWFAVAERKSPALFQLMELHRASLYDLRQLVERSVEASV